MDQAPEGINVTTVFVSNSSYTIAVEPVRPGARSAGAQSAGTCSRAMLGLARPDLGFVMLANGMGVPATRATPAGGFAVRLGMLAAVEPALAQAAAGGAIG